MLSVMRTTLTIDADIADFLKEQSRLHGKSFKQVVDAAPRDGAGRELEATEAVQS